MLRGILRSTTSRNLARIVYTSTRSSPSFHVSSKSTLTTTSANMVDGGKSIIGEAAEAMGLTKKKDSASASPEGGAQTSTGSTSQPPAQSEPQPALKNRAGESRSPYVRGHQNNPVAWQLWGDEAIELAKKQNKMLFVSIGYSACHWCHVMERESFENADVAQVLNTKFIPIKIDREERPDIDRIYMNFVQATTGSGGWPLNVFVTPELEPVFGGTYWPGPGVERGMGFGFLEILEKLSTVWREQEHKARSESSQILAQLRDFANEGSIGGAARTSSDDGEPVDLDLLEEAYSHLAKTYDATYSGFGAAPKFPTPTKIAFLLRLSHFPAAAQHIVGEAEVTHAQSIAVATLRAMARGGIRDHIGHGFARYSVTRDWNLPHFEKMLYDNAQLLHTYLDAFLGLPEPDREILGVVYDLAKYLTSLPIAAPAGGFYSSEDADSLYRPTDAEKREGAFYVWTKREFDSILTQQESQIASTFWGVKRHGNIDPEHDVHDEFLDQNTLRVSSTPASLAKQFGMKEEEVLTVLKSARAKLRRHREEERGRPGVDDKIVAGWNGLAVGALARTAAALREVDPEMSKRCFDAATKTVEFITKEMYNLETKVLKRVWREGPGDTDAFADDYAFLIEGLLDLYEATYDDSYLKLADDLQGTQIKLFLDEQQGGFFSTPVDAKHTILRLKEGMDNAEPSTNGVSATNLARLGLMLQDDRYRELSAQTVKAFEPEMSEYPWLLGSFMPAVVCGVLGGKGVIRVKGSTDSAVDEAPLTTGDVEVADRAAAAAQSVLDSTRDKQQVEQAQAAANAEQPGTFIQGSMDAQGRLTESGDPQTGANTSAAGASSFSAPLDATSLPSSSDPSSSTTAPPSQPTQPSITAPETMASSATDKALAAEAVPSVATLDLPTPSALPPGSPPFHSQDMAHDVAEQIKRPTVARKHRLPNARGTLETNVFVDLERGVGGWARTRNPLLKDVKGKKDGGTRVLVCEGGACREVEEGEGGELLG